MSVEPNEEPLIRWDVAYSPEQMAAAYNRLRAMYDAAEARAVSAERERDELRAAQGWRTIDSAPRDGTHILMHGEQNYHEGVRFGGAVTVSGYWDAIDEAWCSTGSTWTGPFYAPTHWQPLPSPPTR